MQRLVFILVFLLTFLVQSQNTAVKKSYVKYKDFKASKGNKNLVLDSIGFKIDNKDTLVEIKSFNPKGVSVPYEYKDSVFLKEYKKLVYNKDNQKNKLSKNPTMKYWKSEIKVYFDSTVSNINRKELTKFFKYIDKEIDSLKISFVNKKTDSNYFIYCINKPNDINWEDRIVSKTDGFYENWDGKQRIISCTLKLDTQKLYNQKVQITTLKKQFLISLGYFYTIENRDCKSYFSNCFSIDKELTKEDLELLKYHYSYGICKGTDLETFEKNHKRAQEIMKLHPESPPMSFIHMD